MKDELTLAANQGMNVVILLSYVWKNKKEFHVGNMHDKVELAEHILDLEFNKEGKSWLVMLSGDSHMVTFDSGEYNLYGGFPIFQCSDLDSGNSCK